MTQLTLANTVPMFARTVQENFPLGSVTWRKGERCTVTGHWEAVEWMVCVTFGDGSQGIFKPAELGIRAADVPAYVARVKAGAK